MQQTTNLWKFAETNINKQVSSPSRSLIKRVNDPEVCKLGMPKWLPRKISKHAWYQINIYRIGIMIQWRNAIRILSLKTRKADRRQVHVNSDPKRKAQEQRPEIMNMTATSSKTAKHIIEIISSCSRRRCSGVLNSCAKLLPAVCPVNADMARCAKKITQPFPAPSKLHRPACYSYHTITKPDATFRHKTLVQDSSDMFAPKNGSRLILNY